MAELAQNARSRLHCLSPGALLVLQILKGGATGVVKHIVSAKNNFHEGKPPLTGRQILEAVKAPRVGLGIQVSIY